MGVEGVGGARGAQPMSGVPKPPQGFDQIDNTGVWASKYAKDNGNLEGWVAGKKDAGQIQQMLNKDAEGKKSEVVPETVSSTSKTTTFELRMANPYPNP